MEFSFLILEQSEVQILSSFVLRYPPSPTMTVIATWISLFHRAVKIVSSSNMLKYNL